MRSGSLTLFAAIACSCAQTPGAEIAYPRARLLMEPAKLARPEVAKGFVVLDVRKEDAYQKAHVPGARRVDHDAWKKALGDGRDSEGWSKRIGRLGIRADSKVVVYDDNSMKDAARIWWILRYWGVDDARLLDGGWKTWKAEDYPTTRDVPAPATPTALKAEAITRQLATLRQVVDSLKHHDLQIVDARSQDEHCGIDKRKNKRAGAIPGAKHLQWSDLIDKTTDRFKSPEELRRLFDQAGIDLQRPTASHCQSGGRASVMAFGLELMGTGDVRNYYAGWSQWGNRDDTPVAVPKKSEEPEK